MSKRTAKIRSLTAKQQAFVDAYVGVARLNGHKAAEIAGYAPDMCSEMSLRNLRNPAIQAAIREFLEIHSMTAAEVLAELTHVAKLPIEEFPGVLADPRQIKNKVQALAVLAKHHGLLIDRVDHTTAGQPLTFADLAKLATTKSDEQS